MDRRSVADTYRQSSIENAPPIKIIRLLYEGALRFLDQAALENPADPGSRFIHLLGRVDAIVTELRLAIDHSLEAKEVATNLERLYLFCEDELNFASAERDTTRLPGVRQVLATLLDAWQHVEVVSEAA